PGHGNPVTAIACGRLRGVPFTATAGEDAIVRIWDLKERALTETIALPEPAQHLTVSRDGTLIIAMNWEIVALSGTFPTEAPIR
ncbi:hypothetical protein ACFQ07_08270, partial [Actinomadura adrarensis]